MFLLWRLKINKISTKKNVNNTIKTTKLTLITEITKRKEYNLLKRNVIREEN